MSMAQQDEDKNMDRRTFDLRIRVTQELRDDLENVCRSELASQQDVIERLVQWFVEMDDTAQSIILGKSVPLRLSCNAKRER